MKFFMENLYLTVSGIFMVFCLIGIVMFWRIDRTLSRIAQTLESDIESPSDICTPGR